MNVTESDCVTFIRNKSIDYLYITKVYSKYKKFKIIK